MQYHPDLSRRRNQGKTLLNISTELIKGPISDQAPCQSTPRQECTGKSELDELNLHPIRFYKDPSWHFQIQTNPTKIWLYQHKPDHTD